MDIEDQLKFVRDSIQAWADQNQAGTGVFVAADPAHMWHIAYNATSKIRVIVCCTGEEIRGEFATAAALGRVDRQFSVLVSKGRAFATDRGMSLTDDVQNSPPLFRIVQNVRDVVRSLLNISEEYPVDYKGFESYPLENNTIMDAYVIRFSTANDLPQITSTPLNDATPVLQP